MQRVCQFPFYRNSRRAEILLNENINTFEDGYGPRRVRQKRSSPDDTEPKPISRPQMPDSNFNARYSFIIDLPCTVFLTLCHHLAQVAMEVRYFNLHRMSVWRKFCYSHSQCQLCGIGCNLFIQSNNIHILVMPKISDRQLNGDSLSIQDESDEEMHSSGGSQIGQGKERRGMKRSAAEISCGMHNSMILSCHHSYDRRQTLNLTQQYVILFTSGLKRENLQVNG